MREDERPTQALNPSGRLTNGPLSAGAGAKPVRPGDFNRDAFLDPGSMTLSV
jgi:hypothetical protein